MALPFLPQQMRSTTPSGRQGFTTIELMVTVSILALLMALAAPSFNPMIESWRVRQATEQLQSTLSYARSEAIKRGGQVAICRIPDDCIDEKRYPLFMARAVIKELIEFLQSTGSEKSC